jgi:D-proline reductase (dithiol) PrdB
MTVDSFKYLPRIIATYYRMTAGEPELPIPWNQLPKPLEECTFGLVTTGGLYSRGVQLPFDIERERADPTWGDPTYRTLPSDIQQEDVGISHLHINTADALKDVNILLPVHRFRYLVAEGRIGGLARSAFSFMGYQGFPADTSAWRDTYVPLVASELRTEGADCVFLTPA